MARNQVEENVLIGKMHKIMNLRSKGYVVDFDFPAIVVIGSQSSGKSSVIEGIIGRHVLPRGTNMVTQCPIVLNLVHEPRCEKDFVIFAPTEWDPKPKPIDDFSKVREEIRLRMHKLVQGKNISNKPVTLNIHSEQYPNNLQLIDLPGFVRNSVNDQPADIKEQIENLVQSYIEKENTIILAVSDGMVDIAESAGIAEARKVDKKGLRTVGVITKIDLLTTKERQNTVLEILNNRLLSLSKGYVAVINPPSENGESEGISSMREKEMELFKTIFSSKKQKIKNCGTAYLQKKMANELSQKIREKIPELVVKVNEELEGVINEIESLDYKSEALSMDPNKKLMDKTKIYNKSVTVMLKGNSREVSYKQVQGGAILKKNLKKDMKLACKEAMTINPAEFGKDIQIMLENLDATYDSILPNAIAFENCVSILVEKFKKPLSLLITKFAESLNSYLRDCADDTLDLTPTLKQTIIEIMSDKILEYRELCKSDINRHIEIQKFFINYGHPEFKNYEGLLRGTIKSKTPLKEDEEFHDADNGDNNEEEEEEEDSYPDLSEQNENKAIAWIKQRATAFVHFQKDIIKKCKLGVPFDTKSRKDFFLEIVLAYMLILETIIYDTAVKLVMYHMINNICDFIEGQDLFLSLIDRSPEEIDDLLQIDEYKREKLDQLLDQKESLFEVLKVLRD